jgi:3-hydroxyisobutyrate dehydrogenase-like beta-hydroxyacid dehydrogenase
MMAAVHEAMVLAGRVGVDPAVLQHVIADTGVLDQAVAPFFFGGPGPLPPDAPPSLRTVLEHTGQLADKDLAQAQDLAARTGVPLAVLDAVRTGFPAVVRRPPPALAGGEPPVVGARPTAR